MAISSLDREEISVLGEVFDAPEGGFFDFFLEGGEAFFYVLGRN